MDIELVIVQGSGLKSADSNGLSDPYVKFQIGDKKYKTRIIYKTLNPVWNELFVVKLNFKDKLVFDIYDHDKVGKDDFIGRTELTIPQLYNDQKVVNVLNIGVQGVITISLRCTGNGIPKQLNRLNVRKPMVLKFTMDSVFIEDETKNMKEKELKNTKFAVGLKTSSTKKQITKKFSATKSEIEIGDDLYCYAEVVEKFEICLFKYDVEDKESLLDRVYFDCMDFQKNEKYSIKAPFGETSYLNYSFQCLESIYDDILPGELEINPRKLFTMYLKSINKEDPTSYFICDVENLVTKQKYESNKASVRNKYCFEDKKEMYLLAGDKIKFTVYKAGQSKEKIGEGEVVIEKKHFENYCNPFEISGSDKMKLSGEIIRKFKVTEELNKKFRLDDE